MRSADRSIPTDSKINRAADELRRHRQGRETLRLPAKPMRAAYYTFTTGVRFEKYTSPICLA